MIDELFDNTLIPSVHGAHTLCKVPATGFCDVINRFIVCQL